MRSEKQSKSKLYEIIADQETIIECQAEMIRNLSDELALLTAGEGEEEIGI